MMPNTDQRWLQQRLRAIVLLGSLLLPAFCGFPFLAFVASGALRWLAIGLWLVIGGVLAWLVVRALRTLRALDTYNERPR